MQRTDLIEQVRGTLARAGFAVSDRCDLRPVSFDLVARRDRELVIVKILSNVDALSELVAGEIKTLCKFLEGRPILVGLRAGTGPLEEGVIYNRHDIPIMTPGTLESFMLGGEAPMVFAAPGGFYVRIDPEALRRARMENAISLGMMAQIAGVSRRAIQMYEEGMSASIEAAMRLEEFLQRDLIRPLDPLAGFDAGRWEPRSEQGEDPIEGLILRMLEGLGYQVHATRRSPFNAVTREEGGEAMLTGIGADSPSLRRRARVVTSVSRITERPGFFVVEQTTRTSIEGMPVVSREELEKLRDPERILKLILSRST